MQELRGVAASPGIAMGPWVRVERAPVPVGRRIEPSEAPAQVARLAEASESAAVELDAIAAGVAAGGHEDEAAIFSAQAAMARDPALAAIAGERIAAGEDAIGAILAAAAAFADQLRSLGDELLAARAADLRDVGDRIARLLAGLPAVAGPTLDRPSIVVADDLPPSVTATLRRERLLGLALEGSSPTAHAAILARAYAIPAVVGIRGLLGSLAVGGRGRELAIDGSTGEVVVDPDDDTLGRFAGLARGARRRREEAERDAALPAMTLDGIRIALLANIGTPAEAAEAIALGAEGVGLFRTEFLFLERSSPPSEAEQVEAYRSVVEAFAPHPVAIRLLDVGGDKPIPYLRIAPEANPFLGVRALRLAEADPSVFVGQLRACYRAATEVSAPGAPAGSVKVMAPMVADAADTDLLLRLADRARRDLAAEGVAAGEVALGVMLEIPSAILVADSYFGRLAFASLGTNDLLQYALAVDRGNPALERYRDSLHPAVLRLIRDAVEAADRAGIELSVCGEMAGDPAAALALVGLGIRSLSMAASSLPAVRSAIRGARADDLREAAIPALSDASASDVRRRFEAVVAAGPRADDARSRRLRRGPPR